MPVRKVTLPGGVTGYQWGQHGHVYTGKNAQEKATKQGQAAHAAGYGAKKAKK